MGLNPNRTNLEQRKGSREIGLSGQKWFENGELQPMIRKRINSFLLKLRYLRLLAEINILIGFNGVRRESDFRKAKV